MVSCQLRQQLQRCACSNGCMSGTIFPDSSVAMYMQIMPHGYCWKARCKISVPIKHKLSMNLRLVHTTQVQSIPLWYKSTHIPLKIAHTFKHSCSCLNDQFLLFLMHTMYIACCKLDQNTVTAGCTVWDFHPENYALVAVYMYRQEQAWPVGLCLSRGSVLWSISSPSRGYTSLLNCYTCM